MNEYICLKCHKIFHAGASYARCCGRIQEFSPEVHGRMLIGSSNSWISVWEKWKDNPIFIEVADELSERGSYGAATAINAFIEKLIDEREIS